MEYDPRKYRLSRQRRAEGQTGYFRIVLSFASIFALPTSSRVVTTRHVSVLLNETLDGLAIKPGGRYIDGTVGGGPAAILASAPDVEVLGLDADRRHWNARLYACCHSVRA
jgi:hypothetical protein